MDRLLQRDKLQSDSSSEDVFLLASEEPKNARKGTSTESSIAVCLLAQQQLSSLCHQNAPWSCPDRQLSGLTV